MTGEETGSCPNLNDAIMLPAGWEVSLGDVARLYVRHRPARALLYQIVDEYYPAFKQHLNTQEAYLPGYVEQEFDEVGK